MKEDRKIYKTMMAVISFMGMYFAVRTISQQNMTLTLYQAFWGNSSLDKHNHRPIPVADFQAISKDDIYVSIKTTGKYHKSRVALILKTWWNGIKEQAYFFTDVKDATLSKQTNGHVVVTNCGKTHYKFHLCCKMGAEYDNFFDSGKRWWCHFDDDNYVNPSTLVDVLNEYNSKLPIYIGQRSLNVDQHFKYKNEVGRFRFATGGAGICITRKMSILMSPWVRNGSFVTTCKDLNQSDDVTIGFIVTNRLGLNLTPRYDFHSHTELLQRIPRESLLSQVVLSYSNTIRKGHVNVINLPDEISAFPFKSDKSRMLSYHCMKYPSTCWCPKT